MGNYLLHEKDKHLWSSFLQMTGNEVNFRFGSAQEKDKKPFTKLSANGFLGFKSYIIWCLGPDSNRHGVTTEGF